MNDFKFTIQNDNYAITPVENLFINHYMPHARGDYVKVYLFGLKHCHNRSLDPIDNLELSKILDMTEGDVIRAWEYWQREGIVALEYSGTNDVIVTYYNISAKLAEYHKSTTTATAEKKEPTAPKADSMESRIGDMHRKIQKMYGSRTITLKEMNLFKEWITDYHFTPETIVLLVEYSMNLISKKNTPFTTGQIISYLCSVADGWYKANVRDYAAADSHIRQSAHQQKIVYDVFKYLGLHRAPIEWEREMIEAWVTIFHYDMDIITEAMKRTNKTDIRYINGTLKNWHEKKYTTLEQIHSEPKPTPSQKSNRAPGEVAISEERKQAYLDLDQLDEAWLWQQEDSHE